MTKEEELKKLRQDLNSTMSLIRMMDVSVVGCRCLTKGRRQNKKTQGSIRLVNLPNLIQKRAGVEFGLF